MSYQHEQNNNREFGKMIDAWIIIIVVIIVIIIDKIIFNNNWLLVLPVSNKCRFSNILPLLL